jgi:hypothetical protein
MVGWLVGSLVGSLVTWLVSYIGSCYHKDLLTAERIPQIAGRVTDILTHIIL